MVFNVFGEVFRTERAPLEHTVDRSSGQIAGSLRLGHRKQGRNIFRCLYTMVLAIHGKGILKEQVQIENLIKPKLRITAQNSGHDTQQLNCNLAPFRFVDFDEHFFDLQSKGKFAAAFVREGSRGWKCVTLHGDAKRRPLENVPHVIVECWWNTEKAPFELAALQRTQTESWQTMSIFRLNKKKTNGK